MNQPTIEEFNELRHIVFKLSAKVDRLDEAEKKRDFTIRDSAVKIGIAEGLAKINHEALSKLETKLVEVEAQVRELRDVSNQQFESMNQKLDRQEIMIRENNDLLRKLIAKFP